MPRPRRAAAVRATAARHAALSPASPAPLPPRRPRRSTLRATSFVPRKLSRRRADFERIVAHHVQSSSPPERPLPSDRPSVDPDAPVQLTAEWTLAALDAQPTHIPAQLRALLRTLQKLPNRTEQPSSEHSESDLKALTELLATDRCMSHELDAVRLFTACCLAELLRICAPEPPISSLKLNQVCSLFVEQLAAIASQSDGMEVFRFSLLEQLATVKTFVIFCDEHDIVCDMFACFYAVARPHQPAKIRQYLADILVSLLEEMEQIDKVVMDALLAPLVPALKYSQSAVTMAERVVYESRNVIQVPVCSLLNASIRILQHLDGAPSSNAPSRRKSPSKRARTGESSDDVSELSEHHQYISDLLVAINRVAPEILIYVIPNLEDRIRSMEIPTRLGNVHLLAELFTSRSDMVDSYPSLFAEFLTRNRDVEPQIRAEVCAALPDLMIGHPRRRDALDNMLRDRAMDKDESVRVVAVSAIGKAVDVASDELLKLFSTRLRDRKPAVRQEALRQVAVVYRTQQKGVPHEISAGNDAAKLDSANDKDTATLRSEPKNSGNDTVAASGARDSGGNIRIQRLSWLPSTLMQAHMALRGAGDFSAAFAIENVIFEGITDLKSDDPEACKERMKRFAMFLCHLEENDAVQFAALLQERSRTRNALLKIAEFRLKARTHSPTESSQASNDSPPKTFSKRVRRKTDKAAASSRRSDPEEIRAVAMKLAKSLPGKAMGPDNALDMCTAIASAVDLRFYDQIMKTISFDSTSAEFSAACKDAVARLGSKSVAGIFLREQILPRCRPGIFSSIHFEIACDIAEEESSSAHLEKTDENIGTQPSSLDDSSSLLCGCLRYLDIASKYVHEVLQKNVSAVRSLAVVEVGPDDDAGSHVLLCGLKLLSRLSEEVCKNAHLQNLYPKLETHMVAKVDSDVEQCALLAKWAARAAIWLAKDTSVRPSPLMSIVKALSESIDRFSGDLENVIAPITALSQFAKFSTEMFKPVSLESFDFARALLCGSLNKKIREFESVGQPWRKKSRHSRRLSRRASIPASVGVSVASLPENITDFRASCMVEVIQRSLKLLIYGLPYVNTNNEELNNVIKILMEITNAKDGDIFGASRDNFSDDVNSEEEDKQDESSAVIVMRAVSRLSAARAMLFLGRDPKYFRGISPSVFISTVLCAQDEHPDVRIAFAKTVYTSILKKRLPLRWIVSLPLMAIEPDRDNLVQVRSMLTSLFRYRRRVFEKAKLDGNASALQLLPESTISEFIWVLANLPDVEVDQGAGFPESEKCLELHIDRLLESNEYAGVLNEHLESLYIAQDASEEEGSAPGAKTERIGQLARIAGNILKKKQAGRKWTLAEHRSQVMLPKDLFRVIPKNVEVSTVPPSVVAAAPKYGSEVDMTTPSQEQKEVDSRTGSERGKSSASKALNLSAVKDHERLGDTALSGLSGTGDQNASDRETSSRGQKRLSIDLFETSSLHAKGEGSEDQTGGQFGCEPSTKKTRLSPKGERESEKNKEVLKEREGSVEKGDTHGTEDGMTPCESDKTDGNGKAGRDKGKEIRRAKQIADSKQVAVSVSEVGDNDDDRKKEPSSEADSMASRGEHSSRRSTGCSSGADKENTTIKKDMNTARDAMESPSEAQRTRPRSQQKIGNGQGVLQKSRTVAKRKAAETKVKSNEAVVAGVRRSARIRRV